LITTITLSIVAFTSIALFAYGLNLLYLTWHATRLKSKQHPFVTAGSEPQVCIQVPVYDERYVAERVIDAVCAIEWPRERLEVQILDDSDDETSAIVSKRAAHWRHKGVAVTHIRRGTRDGYKAGALAHGLTLTTAPFIAIFDADFVPPCDFLRRMVGAFDDPQVGFAQARWGHLDEGYSWFTRLQALVVDFHFLVEQAVRSSRGYFTNFTGTAGVWRRAAIEDAGGWSGATLTEDLDLSYRAQLRGWRAAYLEDVVVPEELPVSIDAYRRQQSRWATGSFQCAFSLLGPVLLSRNRTAAKVQAAIHLLAYGVGPLMLIQVGCYPLLLVTASHYRFPWPLAYASFLTILIGITPWICFMVAQTRRGRSWWSGAHSILFQVVGAGMSLNTLIALIRATRPGGEFVRTPKHRIVERGQEWRDQAYVRVGDPRAAAEAILGLAALAIIPAAVAAGLWLIAMYSGLFAVGFIVVAGLSAVDLLEVITLRRLGRRALTRLRVALPGVGLLGLCGLLLLLAAQMPEPFEDGYGHWLIAANLASTGQLHDPLFGMEDTWLPGYHVMAAAVLRVFGLWQLGSLKALGALLGLLTLACVYWLAPTVRQGRMAVILLVLNPVFLFTSSSAVVEPLLTALLVGAALAAVQRRMRLAALLAALAAVTATKAWIWIGAVLAVVVIEQVHARVTRRATRPLPAAAWALPAVALLAFVQLGYAPASHSIARGSVEVLSASARGSIPGGALARLLELTTTFGLAALPLFALGLVGLVWAVRRPESMGGPAALRFLHVPAMVYLVAVFGLVAAGAYSGSHRYLYPALPSLALLAAAALDRQQALARLGAVAAGALLAVAFLPTFASFAAGNAGLIAAGQAATGDHGMLITDSPVVAFYSGRMPSEISGSQALPADRQQAIAWMDTHGVTAVVLEDISYYRATSIFPDLASGHATAPFGALGAQARYQVAGGKPVYAYRLGTALLTQSIFPGVDARIEGAFGKGKTAPLAKGLVLEIAGKDSAAEGMGFGVPIVQYPDGWVYSSTATTDEVSTPTSTIWRRTYQLNEIGGDAAHGYAFVPIESRGLIEVTYTIDTTGIAVSVHMLRLAPGFTEVGILNEQSSAFNDFAADNGPTLIDGNFGRWVPVDGAWARLQSKSLGVQFSLPSIAGAQMHGGRELVPPDFDWAGLDYIFGPSFTDTSYVIRVQEAR